MNEQRKLTERKLTEWLADYRDSLDDLSTPSVVGLRLRAEVRSRRRIPVAPWILASGAAAVLLLGIWIGRTRPTAQVQVLTPELAQHDVASPAPVGVAEVPTMVALPRAVERLPSARARRAVRPPQAMPDAVAPVFVMLPGSDLMPPAQDLQVLRVRIPRTRIQALGWPVNVDRLDERVLADVLVGNDGVARAVRLVGASQ